jgi:hypothetical protein
MVTYRFFTMSTSGEMLSSSCADHATDAQARFHAALRLRPGERVEVWRDRVCIWDMSARALAGAWYALRSAEQTGIMLSEISAMPAEL